MTEVDTELPAPDGDPLDVVGTELWREGEDDVLLVAGGQPGDGGVPVVEELAPEGVREDHAGPCPRRSLSSHPEESVWTSTVIREVLYQELVLLGSEVDLAGHAVEGMLELPEQSLDPADEGRDLRGVVCLCVLRERTGIVGTGLGLTGLSSTDCPLGSCLGEEPVPPPLSSRSTGDAAGLPAAPLGPLTGGAEPWEDVSQVITVIISLHIITPPLL